MKATGYHNPLAILRTSGHAMSGPVELLDQIFGAVHAHLPVVRCGILKSDHFSGVNLYFLRPLEPPRALTNAVLWALWRAGVSIVPSEIGSRQQLGPLLLHMAPPLVTALHDTLSLVALTGVTTWPTLSSGGGFSCDGGPDGDEIGRDTRKPTGPSSALVRCFDGPSPHFALAWIGHGWCVMHHDLGDDDHPELLPHGRINLPSRAEDVLEAVAQHPLMAATGNNQLDRTRVQAHIDRVRGKMDDAAGSIVPPGRGRFFFFHSWTNTARGPPTIRCTRPRRWPSSCAWSGCSSTPRGCCR